MGKAKTLKEQKKFARTGYPMKLKKKPRKYDPMKDLLDEHLIAEAIWDCLKENDPEGVVEILEFHFRAKNKSKLSKEHGISRTTIYHAFRSKNPTLQTVAKLVHAIA